MKKVIIPAIISLLLVSSCKKTTVETEAPESQELMSRSAIDVMIRSSIEHTGVFEWGTVNSNTVWSALQQSDNILSVGYQPAGKDISNTIQLVNINDAE